MTDPGLLRFLELVTRELGADDARVELGGKDPEAPNLVFRNATTGARIVVVFAEPPVDRAAVEARLDALVVPFFGTAEHAIGGMPMARTPPDIAGRRLDDELGRVTDRSGATCAVVFDLASPIVWGASATADSAVDRRMEEAILAIREAKDQLRPGHSARLEFGEMTCLARPFAGLYVVALVFVNAEVSEPVALGALLHALPFIERLVLALPPIDPSPGGAKIMRMPTRLR